MYGVRMSKLDLVKSLAGKWDAGNRPKDLFEREVAKAPARFAPQIVEGLSAKSRRVQNGCAELASLLSAAEPELLAPHLDLFVKNLDAPEAVLRWEAACTLGNLAASDRTGKVRSIVPKLLELLEHESIVLQGHSAKALARIARAFPAAAPKILDGLVAAAPAFPGSRAGYLVEAMESFAGLRGVEAKARSFAEKHQQSEHGPVASKARRALRKLCGESPARVKSAPARPPRKRAPRRPRATAKAGSAET